MTEGKKRNGRLTLGLLSKIVLIMGVQLCHGQTGKTVSRKDARIEGSHPATMTFDVASVRENKNLNLDTGFMVSGGFKSNTTAFRAVNWSIEDLIGNAYGVDRSQIVGAPKWPWPTLFIVEAKSDSDSEEDMARLTDEQQLAEHRHMLQLLLEDRFILKTHWEIKESDIYNLLQGKGGAKLGAAGSMPPSSDELKRFNENPVPALYQKNDGRGYDFIAHGCSMDRLADTLTAQFGRPVLNKTTLTGSYDFVLKYRGRSDHDRDPEDLDPMPPMDKALAEELGLRVEAAKGPVKVLIVDHIAKPSPN